MTLTIAVCAGSFAVIYAALDPFTSDFVTRGNPGEVETPEQLAANPDNESTTTATEPPPAQDQPQPPPTPTQTPPPPPSSPTAEAFDPDYQIVRTAVNLRTVPSATQGPSTIVRALPPATPLQYLGEDAPTAGPQDGDRWMRFETEEGEEGWIREIDVEPYQE
ncbi:MAG: SH3 domain-containing protein [Chloroflexota bacterium]|nr:SH3 domain-containing protein [Chloroflexota bacterium]